MMKQSNNPNKQKKSAKFLNSELIEQFQVEQPLNSIELLLNNIYKIKKLSTNAKVIRETIYGLFLIGDNRYFIAIEIDRRFILLKKLIKQNIEMLNEKFKESSCELLQYQEQVIGIQTNTDLENEREFNVIEITQHQGDLDFAIQQLERIDWISLYDKARYYWVTNYKSEFPSKSLVEFQMEIYSKIEKTKFQYLYHKFIQIQLSSILSYQEFIIKAIGVLFQFEDIQSLEITGEFNCELVPNLFNIELVKIRSLKNLCLMFKQRYKNKSYSLNMVENVKDQKDIYEESVQIMIQFVQKQTQLIHLNFQLQNTYLSQTMVESVIETIKNLKQLKSIILKLCVQYEWLDSNQEFQEMYLNYDQLFANLHHVNQIQNLCLNINLSNQQVLNISEQLKSFHNLESLTLKMSQLKISKEGKQKDFENLINSLKDKQHLRKLQFDILQKNDLYEVVSDLGQQLSQLNRIQYLQLTIENGQLFEIELSQNFSKSLSKMQNLNNLSVSIQGEIAKGSILMFTLNLKNIPTLHHLTLDFKKYDVTPTESRNIKNQIYKCTRLCRFQQKGLYLF